MRKAILLSIALLFVSGIASAQKFQYGAKFFCGANKLGGVLTIINVHTPFSGTKIYKRFSVGLSQEKAGELTDFFTMTLEPGRTMQVDCADIWAHLKLPALTVVDGFVDIRSDAEIDVVEVYTTFGTDTVIRSFSTERVPMRPVP